MVEIRNHNRKNRAISGARQTRAELRFWMCGWGRANAGVAVRIAPAIGEQVHTNLPSAKSEDLEQSSAQAAPQLGLLHCRLEGSVCCGRRWTPT